MMNTNNDLKLSSLELCKNSKEEVGPDRSVSSNKFSSVTLNKLAMNSKICTVISSFSNAVNQKTDINQMVSE